MWAEPSPRGGSSCLPTTSVGRQLPSLRLSLCPVPKRSSLLFEFSQADNRFLSLHGQSDVGGSRWSLISSQRATPALRRQLAQGLVISAGSIDSGPHASAGEENSQTNGRDQESSGHFLVALTRELLPLCTTGPWPKVKSWGLKAQMAMETHTCGKRPYSKSGC